MTLTFDLSKFFTASDNIKLTVEIKKLQDNIAVGTTSPAVVAERIAAMKHLVEGTAPIGEKTVPALPAFRVVADEWLSSRKIAERDPKTVEKKRGHIAAFISVCKNLPVNAYTKEHARKFEAYLDDLTNGKGKRNNYTTLNRYILTVSAVFEYAKSRYDTSVVDPMTGIKFEASRKTGDDTPKVPFKQAELVVLLAGLDPNSEMYWITLLGLYAGLSNLEVVQLRRDDIRLKDGVLSLFIHGDDGNKLKARRESKRDIPLHWALLKNGFTEYVSKQKDYLFPETTEAKRHNDRKTADYWSNNMSANFSNLLKRLGLKRDDLTYYSLRHTFKDGLDNGGVPEDRRKRLMGHSKSDAHAGYGAGPNAPNKKADIDKIVYGIPFENGAANASQVRSS